ncbi:MAG: non-canonical purine NTP pyrophosphatase, partial [Schwartzia sp.]|nr:non-canonical purine NTP pyrophosphatase [Schwartzia sp. (in: firmicutes)]
FGYDPYFYVGEEKTMAELTIEEKHIISHRGDALRAMAVRLRDYLPG